MKRLALAASLLALTCAASAQTADSAAVETSAVETAAAEAAAPQATAAAASEASASQNQVDAKEEVNDRNCLKHTGSRLITADSKGRKCANATGRSYTREDIDRTGAFDLQDAIRRLDPAVH